MDGENRRSKEAVRNSIRAYGVKVMDPASLPLKKTKETESQESVSRFSERSLHSHYEMDEGCNGCCRSCLNRVPYATLVAFIICILGVLFVVVANQRTVTLSRSMMRDVLKEDSNAASVLNIVLICMCVITAGVAVLILVIGILTTGDTRDEVYKAWRARISGRISCIFLMVVTLVLELTWFVIVVGICLLNYLVAIAKLECDLHTAKPSENGCLNVSFLSLIFGRDNIRDICGSQQIKGFCKDFVEKVIPTTLVTDLGLAMIIIALILFLMCLSANYAKIRSQSKLQEFQEMRQVGMMENKNRF